MLQNLMLESSNRFSRGAKKQPIKGMQRAFNCETLARILQTLAHKSHHQQVRLARSCPSRTSSALRRQQKVVEQGKRSVVE